MPWRDSSLRIAQVSHWMLLRTVGRCQDGGSEPVLGSDYGLRPDGRTGGSSSCIHHSTTGVLRRPRTSLKCVASTRGCGPFSAVVRIFSGYDHRLGQKKPSRGLRLWRVSNEGQRWPCRAQHDSRPRAVAYPHIISSTGRQQEPRTIMPCRHPHRHSVILAVQKTH